MTSRERIQSYKRVIQAFRLEGVSDQRLAEAIRPLVGAGLDASDLHAAISADLVSGLNDY